MFVASARDISLTRKSAGDTACESRSSFLLAMVTLGVGLPLVFFAFIAPSPSSTVQAALTNVTIDDTNSNFWTFAGSWHAVTPTTPCGGCSKQPDPGLTHNSTWHDGELRSGSFTFQGQPLL
jgi:hypothetical protein